ncbi:MAG: S8 family peptidase [Bacteroidales bacterium]|nr:S8 family peptidase [Bacteroidales bacterium]
MRTLLKCLNKAFHLLSYILTFSVVSAQNNLNIIHLPEAYRLLYNSIEEESKVVIAIIDRGVDVDHEDLWENIWNNPFEVDGNLIDDDMNGFVDDINGWNFDNNSNNINCGGAGHWHGTPVNGIIGASHNDYGVNGVCDNVKLLNLIKGEGTESIKNSLRYIYCMRKDYNMSYGKKGAFVVAVNCSWGKDFLWGKDYPEWCSLYDSLGNVGVLCVSSVPNLNFNVDEYGDMPTTCNSDYLITVTNTDLNDIIDDQSAFGNISVDIGAPGSNSFTTINTGGYGYFGGTSAAAPYVSGAIGLLYALPIGKFHEDIKNKPFSTALLIRDAIINGADQLYSLNGKTTSGGRLNIFNSMKYLCDYYGESELFQKNVDNFKIVSLCPNPVKSTTSLIFESSTNISAQINIHTTNGSKVMSKEVMLNEGISNIEIDCASLQKGIYLIRVSNERSIEMIKMIKE